MIKQKTSSESPSIPPPKAYSYLRFSSPEQAKGASRKRQIEAAEKWALENGMALDEQLRDEGVSAFRGKNREAASALGGFIARIEKGEVEQGSFLIVESFDRLSREEVVDALEQFLTLTRAGITIVTLTDGRIYNRESLRRDTTQLLISIIIMARAFEESSTKSKRVGHAWSAKREAARRTGQAMTATCPAWIRLVGGPRNGRYELIESRTAVVVGIFSDTIAGEGRRTIVRRLNASGIEPWGVGRKKGRHWHDSYVQKILSSQAAFGRYAMRGETIDDYFPAVVTREVFWKAKAATAQRQFGSGRSAGRFANLLHGVAKCHLCGSNMAYIDKGKRSKPFLRCTKSMASAGCDSAVVAPYRGLEHLTIGLYAQFKDAATFAMRAATDKAASEIDPTEARLAAARTRSDNLAAAIADGGEIGPLRRLLDATEVEIASLETRLAEISTQMAADAMTETDLREREAEINFHLEHGKDDERYARRKLFNVRLCRIVERLIINETGDGYSIKVRNGADPWDEDVILEEEDHRTPEEFLRDEAAFDEQDVDEILWRHGIGG